LPILDEIVRTAEGNVDRAFWRSFFRYESSSGPSLLTGWILALFPYLREQEFERHVDEAEVDEGGGDDPDVSPADDDRGGIKIGPAPTYRAVSERIVPNPYFTAWEKTAAAAEHRIARKQVPSFEEAKGPTIGEIPAGISSAPVLTVDVRDGAEYPLRFAAGLFGVGQDAGGALVPEFGWAVLYEN
jgi:hypothetical protein